MKRIIAIIIITTILLPVTVLAKEDEKVEVTLSTCVDSTSARFLLDKQEIKVKFIGIEADEFIQTFPNKYDTYIEQGGTNVSGGQKQRLCIARAILKNPKIMILDDSTSAVDTKTDRLIRKGLKEDLPEMTKIVIAQRISSIEDADQIIIMDNGTINAIGTHEELLKSNKIYQEVYYTQNRTGGDK